MLATVSLTGITGSEQCWAVLSWHQVVNLCGAFCWSLPISPTRSSAFKRLLKGSCTQRWL